MSTPCHTWATGAYSAIRQPRSYGRRLLGCASVLLGWATLAIIGCQGLDGPAGDFRGQTSPAHMGDAVPPASGVIAPQTFVYWSIQATEGLPNKLMTGQSLVGPEGMMELGPYGAVKVAGLNVDQARSAVERQLSRYLKNPKVTLSLDAPVQGRVAEKKNSDELKVISDESSVKRNRGGIRESDSSLVTHHSSLITNVVPAGWQRGQMEDDNIASTPAQGPTIEIPALPLTLPTIAKNEDGAPTPLGEEHGRKEDARSKTEDRKVTDLTSSSLHPPSAIPDAEIPPAIPKFRAPTQHGSPDLTQASSPNPPAELPLTSTERVSQWRPMMRRNDSSAVPPVTPSWPMDRTTSNRSQVITAVAQDKEILGPPPRQVMPKAADTPKSEVLQGPPPREVIEGHGAPGAYGPHSDILGGSAPREGAKVSLPPYVIEPPDILLIESTQGIRDQPIRGQHLVRPDGTVGLGIYGSAYVAGMTLEQAKESIGRVFAARIKDFDLRNLNVDILAYNSKFYYVITDGAGYGQQVIRMPIVGSETVLDGISQIFGLPAVASKKRIWVARRSADGTTDQVLPVDWCGISQRGSEATNYQIMPGDRIYVDAKKWVRFDTGLARFLSPFERVLGITLLGSETVNSISGRTTGTGGVP